MTSSRTRRRREKSTQSAPTRAIGRSFERLLIPSLMWEAEKGRSSINFPLMQLLSTRKTPHGLLTIHTGSS